MANRHKHSKCPALFDGINFTNKNVFTYSTVFDEDTVDTSKACVKNVFR